jgi:putative tricarboxylic transport membrane protein
MDAFSNLMMGFSVALLPQHLMLAFTGSLLGTLIGVLPGIGPAAGCAMLIPLTFNMGPTGSIILLTALFYGTQYGGTITSVLLNVPGEAASAITCLDGYAMAKQERSPLSAWLWRPDRSPDWRYNSGRWNFSPWYCWESPY